MSGNHQLGHHRKSATVLAFSAALAASIGGAVTALTGTIAVTIALSGVALVLLFFAGLETGRSRSTSSK